MMKVLPEEDTHEKSGGDGGLIGSQKESDSEEKKEESKENRGVYASGGEDQQKDNGNKYDGGKEEWSLINFPQKQSGDEIEENKCSGKLKVVGAECGRLRPGKNRDDSESQKQSAHKFCRHTLIIPVFSGEKCLRK